MGKFKENTLLGGNMNFTFIDNEINKFIKIIPKKMYDYRTTLYQLMLSYNTHLDNLEVPIYTSLIDKETDIEVQYEIIKEKQWELNNNNIELIAKNIALIHNYNYKNRLNIDLSIKNNKYDNLSEWDKLDKKSNQVKLSYNLRKSIFYKIERIDNQVKIPLHRDLRKHNIMYDGNKYYLIDFDFAAIDFISIELGAFIADILLFSENSIDLINLFFKSYFKHLNFKFNYTHIIIDYLNYLCTNTFPFYIKDNLRQSAFDKLVDERNEVLKSIYKNKKELESIIKKNIHEI